MSVTRASKSYGQQEDNEESKQKGNEESKQEGNEESKQEDQQKNQQEGNAIIGQRTATL
ncbi:MAG: hypothetical protein KDK34_12185 [Leptospiraceae bacterium]|nr:hypothetical protein [Leptospiraceae bacterium]